MSLSRRRSRATASRWEVFLLRMVDISCSREAGTARVGARVVKNQTARVDRRQHQHRSRPPRDRGADPKRRGSIQRTCFSPPCTSVILLNVKEEYDRNSGKNGIPELVTSTIRAGCSARAGEGNVSVRSTPVSQNRPHAIAV